MNQEKWPLCIRLLLAPIRIIAFICSLPIVLILVAAGERDRAENIIAYILGE
jgi:hypothetical protein